MVDLERLRDNLKYLRRGRGLTFAKLAECHYLMEALGDVPLRVAYEQLAGMVRMLGEDVQAMALHDAYAIECWRRTPSLGAVSALQASMGSVSTLSSCTSAR
jgi:hypothetical protein